MVFRGHDAVDEINHHADKTLKASGKTQLAETYHDGAGKTRVKGTKALKGSQAYPRELFGGIPEPFKAITNVIRRFIDLCSSSRNIIAPFACRGSAELSLKSGPSSCRSTGGKLAAS